MSVNQTLLWRQGDWGLFRHKMFPEATHDSVIFHRCIKGVVEGTYSEDWNFPCDANQTDWIWKCTACDAIVPDEVVGIWHLHNFYGLAK